MPSWFEGMTSEDHERNFEEMRRETGREAQRARAMEAHWRRTAERLEAMLASSGEFLGESGE